MAELHRLGVRNGVQLTNDDAQISKLSCVRLGYFNDDFVHHFVRRPQRRSPLINRGYYSRYAAIRDLLLRFLAAGVAEGHPLAGVKQVLSLGAGYDTTFFQLAAQGLAPHKYVEVDVPEVTQQKAAAIARTPQLLACLGLEASSSKAAAELEAGPPLSGAAAEAAAGAAGQPEHAAAAAQGVAAHEAEAPAVAGATRPMEGCVLTDQYSLLPADLRQPGSLQAALEQAGLDPCAPTFVLSECVLVYLEPQHSAEVVRWLGQHLQTAAFVVYEQIRPDDAFGRQMLQNLELRGCPLLGIAATPTLEAQAARFTSAGWERAEAESMDVVHRDCLDPEDRRRAERLELFDEVEEWHLIQQHYCIAVGVKDATGSLLAGYGLPRRRRGDGGGPAGAATAPPSSGAMPPPPPLAGHSAAEQQR